MGNDIKIYALAGAVTLCGISSKLQFSGYPKPGSSQHQTQIDNTFKITPTPDGVTAPACCIQRAGIWLRAFGTPPNFAPLHSANFRYPPEVT